MFPLSDAFRKQKPAPSEDSGDDEEKDTQNEGDDSSFQGFVVPQPRLHVTHDGHLEESLLVRTEGWLYKKGGAVNQRGGRKNWKKRWFILAPFDFLGQSAYELQYYDKPNGSLKGSVGLSDVVIFCEARTKHHKIKYEFQLNLPNGGTLELSCDDATEREEWIETINMVIAFMRTLTHPAAMVLNGYDPLDEEDQEIFQMGEEIASNCQAYGPGLYGSEAGKREQFVLQIYDVAGQQVTRGGMPVTCTISNDEVLYYVKVHDNGDGTFAAHYMIGAPGKYKLSIRINDEHEIDGSPFDIEILPSKTVAGCCTAEGEALITVYPERECSFNIVARDALSNCKHRGGDPFEVSILGPAHLESIDDNGDGTYTCVFEAQDPAKAQYFAANTLQINVTLYGKAISGSPFRPIILEAPADESWQQSSQQQLQPQQQEDDDTDDRLAAFLNGDGDGGASPEQTSSRRRSTRTAGVGPRRASAAQSSAAESLPPPPPPPLSDNRSVGSTSQDRVALGAARAKERALAKRQQAAAAAVGVPEVDAKEAALNAMRNGGGASLSGSQVTGQSEQLSVADKGVLQEDLKRGLIGQPSDQATEEERRFWSLGHAAISTPDVLGILMSKITVLKKSFDLLAEMVEDVRVLQLPGLKRLLQEYGVISPAKCSERDVTFVFSLMVSAQANAKTQATTILGGNVLDFAYYLRFLVVIALFAVSKNASLSAEYSTFESKVELLITEWRLGERSQVDIIKSKLRASRR